MQTVKTKTRLVVHSLDNAEYAIDLQPMLPATVTASSVGTVTQTNDSGSADITISGEAANTGSITYNPTTGVVAATGTTIGVGEGITWTMSGGVAGTLYTVTFPVTLSDSSVRGVVQEVQVF